MTELQLEFIRKFSPDNSPVQWHDVFARLKELGYVRTNIYCTSEGEYILWVCAASEEHDTPIECNPCLSPMEQPTLIEQLLLLIK